MNINEIIGAERWLYSDQTGAQWMWKHNHSLDTIEKAVTEHIKKLEARIADLEAENTRLHEKLIIKAT